MSIETFASNLDSAYEGNEVLALAVKTYWSEIHCDAPGMSKFIEYEFSTNTPTGKELVETKKVYSWKN